MESSAGSTSWKLVQMIDEDSNDTPTAITHNSVFSYVMDLSCVTMMCSSSHRYIDMSPQRQRRLSDETEPCPSSSSACRMSPAMSVSGSVYSDACSEQGIPSSSHVGSVISLSTVASSAKTVIVSPHGRPPRTQDDQEHRTITTTTALSPSSYLSHRKSTVVGRPLIKVPQQQNIASPDANSSCKNKLGYYSFGERSMALSSSTSPIYRRSMPTDYADEGTIMSAGTEQSDITTTGSPSASSASVSGSTPVVRLNPYTTRQINHHIHHESNKHLVRKNSGQSECDSTLSTLSSPSTHTTGASTAQSPAHSTLSGGSRSAHSQQQQYYSPSTSVSRRAQSHGFFGTSDNPNSPHTSGNPRINIRGAGQNTNASEVATHGVTNDTNSIHQQKRIQSASQLPIRLFYSSARSPMSGGTVDSQKKQVIDLDFIA